MIVVDASVIVTALGDDARDGATARARLVNETLAAPHLIDIEVLSAWRRLATAGMLSPARAGQAIADFGALRIVRSRHGPLLNRCWELRHNMSSYDATYVALAEKLGAVLVTADERLAAAPGSRCTIEVLHS